MKLSTNEMFIDRNIRTPLNFQLKPNKRFGGRSEKMPEDFVKTMIQSKDGIAKGEMKKYKEKQKEYYDWNTEIPNYKVNELVLHWNEVHSSKVKEKLAMHWKRPHSVP